MNKFPCTSCGACCRRLNLVTEDILQKNGLKADETGRCENLLDNNKCKIYDDRPELCIVDHKKWKINPDFYYKVVAKTCNKWMDEDKSPYERVKL
tara:strand:+ start:1665 stop:1949 length:285 start_codon:yes stop_codon:yes gene_type:complete